VDLLDAQALAFRDLSKFDAIVVGVRAYELRSDAAWGKQRLLDYASRAARFFVHTSVISRGQIFVAHADDNGVELR